MSFNRPMYDQCAYDKRLTESTSVLTWMLDPNRYYNGSECRHEFGIVGGNNVSRFNGNMVDLESDLRNQTRLYSECPTRKYQPGTVIQGQVSNGCHVGRGKTGLPCGSLAQRTNNLKHLNSCSIIHYKPRINHVGYELNYPPVNSSAASFRQTAPRRSRPFRAQKWQSQTGSSQPAKY